MLIALQKFGASPPGFQPSRFEDPKTLLMIGQEPFRIDLLTSIPGIDFVRAWQQRESVELDGIQIPLISKTDLIANKKAVGRLQDLADVEALEAVSRDGV